MKRSQRPVLFPAADFEDNLFELMRRAHDNHASESHSYGFISYLLHTYTATTRGKNCRMTPNPQAYLAAKRPTSRTGSGLPDFGVYVDWNVGLKKYHCLQDIWEIKGPCDESLVSDAAYFHAVDAFSDNFAQLNHYASLMFHQYPVLKSAFVFFSSGNYFSLVEFTRNHSRTGLIDKEDKRKYLSRSKRSSFKKLPDESLRADILDKVDELESMSLQLMKPKVHFFCCPIIHVTPGPNAGVPPADDDGPTQDTGDNDEDADDDPPRSGALTWEIREALRKATEHEDIEFPPSYFDPTTRQDSDSDDEDNDVINYIEEARNRSLDKIRGELDYLIEEAKRNDAPSPLISEYIQSRRARNANERDSTPTPGAHNQHHLRSRGVGRQPTNDPSMPTTLRRSARVIEALQKAGHQRR
ncbi:hypothetical protein C8Q75DRAFT_761648 [Abortiporus biennis]|nr:hypothetical protein C8Q75DRAFT_761648 [Abortiporus biennis]